MSQSDYCFLLAQIFLARSLSPFAALLFAVFWLVVAIFKGW